MKIKSSLTNHYKATENNTMPNPYKRYKSKILMTMKNILSCLLALFCLAYSLPAKAQSSFKEVEKMRKIEEKRLAKLAKDKAKKKAQAANTNVNENNQWQKDKKEKFTGKLSKKDRQNVPKASQNLSRQRRATSEKTQQYRQGKGKTKAAKAQSKNKKRIKGDIEVW